MCFGNLVPLRLCPVVFRDAHEKPLRRLTRESSFFSAQYLHVGGIDDSAFDGHAFGSEGTVTISDFSTSERPPRMLFPLSDFSRPKLVAFVRL